MERPSMLIYRLQSTNLIIWVSYCNDLVKQMRKQSLWKMTGWAQSQNLKCSSCIPFSVGMGHNTIAAFIIFGQTHFYGGELKSVDKTFKLCFKPENFWRPSVQTACYSVRSEDTRNTCRCLCSSRPCPSCFLPCASEGWPVWTASMGSLTFWVLGGFLQQGALAGGDRWGVNDDGVFILPVPFLKVTQCGLHLWGHHWKVLHEVTYLFCDSVPVFLELVLVAAVPSLAAVQSLLLYQHLLCFILIQLSSNEFFCYDLLWRSHFFLSWPYLMGW